MLVSMSLFTVIRLFLLLPAHLAVAAIPASAANSIIRRDVVILGGGASGAHAAVRLREDYGKSIVIVEKQDNLVRGFLYDPVILSSA